MPYRYAVDAMGGDRAPEATVRGALAALRADGDLHIALVGDQERIESILADSDGSNGMGAPKEGVPASMDVVTPWRERLEVVHTAEALSMDDPPVESLRRKKDSSLLRSVSMAAAGDVEAVISAGNTGAMAAACQLKLRALPGVARPGIAVTLPTQHGPVVLCDVGANIHAKTHHLYEYAIMACHYAEQVLDVDGPRVGLLSVGEESLKGTELVRQSHELLRSDEQLAFVGNVEGRDLFRGACDVAVCDGFVGNVVLKLAEGLAEGIFDAIDQEVSASVTGGTAELAPVLERVRRRHDYAEYGGAPLLGVDGTCIICHGRSSADAIRNAILGARRFSQTDFNAGLVARLGRHGASDQGDDAARQGDAGTSDAQRGALAGQDAGQETDSAAAH